MNRQIIFRGKSKCNGEWLYGDLEYNRQKDIARIHTYNKDGAYEGQEIVDAETVCQFTGLFDKNGKEIYEGDILDVEGEAVLYVVEWHDVGLKARQVSNRSTIGLSNWKKYITVIGNVHDNFELLKNQKP